MPDFVIHSGTVARSIAHGSKTIYVNCHGWTEGVGHCKHSAKMMIADLPDVTWREVQRRFRCTKCGTRGAQVDFNHYETMGPSRACNIIGGEIIR